MSRRDGKGQTDRRAPRPSGQVAARPPRSPGVGRWLVAAAGVTAVIALAWLALRWRQRERPGQLAAVPGPATALTPQAAYGKAFDLSHSRRFEESLAYFERALAGLPPEAWLIHYNYAGALYSVGLEERGPHGFSRPALRSSIERVALMRRALAELDEAERLAPTARDRATVIRQRGAMLQIWGFPWDGFVQLRRAQWTDPEEPSHAGVADAYMLVLEHPERGPAGTPPARETFTPPASPP